MTILGRWIDGVIGSARASGSGVRAGVVCGLTVCVACGLLSGVSGCKKPPEPPPPAPKRTPPPPPPQPIEAAGLLQSMDVDARVEFAQDAAPVDRGLAEAAIRLADAMARGDDMAMEALLDRADHSSLSKLVNNGQWYDATGRIEAVRVVSIDPVAQMSNAPETAEVGFAVQDADGAYVLLWSGRKVFDDWIFTARPATDEVRGRASAWDGSSTTMLVDGGGSGFGSGLFDGLPAEVMAQLDALGIDPNNPDPEKLKELLEQVEDSLPAELLQQLRDAIEALGGAPDDGADDSAPDDDAGEGEGGRRPGG